jgi:hypothetical protein
MTTKNPELQLANDYVQYTNNNIYLTGKAGTGKTTFLKNLKKSTAKRMIITAPTGVAAINAGGVTLHSFFQMPFGPFVPEYDASDSNNFRKFSKEKKQIIQNLDLLVIDEISMVRADLLDGIDGVLRNYRRSNLSFGGVQLLMIGDLHQLPPVVKPEDWKILQPFYKSIYFFSSNALAKTKFITLELKKIYRQTDQNFIKLLNQVRDNKLDQSAIKELNKRYIPDFDPPENQGYITLCTHNKNVNNINLEKLENLNNKEHSFSADIQGEFPEYSFPTSAELTLKQGAQVMFVRNDSSVDKLYFNGKIGKITNIKGEIRVKCPEDREEIIVEPVTWENIKYSVDIEKREIREEVIGKFIQYPLKLAWAITIHKSQGLTFEKAIIDANSAFAHGQVYVAISRCKTFSGMVFSSPIAPKSIKTDFIITAFVKNARNNPPSQTCLQSEKIKYQQQLLLDCFDFTLLRHLLKKLMLLLLHNSKVIEISGNSDIKELENITFNEIYSIGENFKKQLRNIFSETAMPESDSYILERIGKASTYFQEKIEAILVTPVSYLQVETDNKEIRKKILNSLNQLKKEIAVKLASVKCCNTGFTPTRYLKAVSGAEIEFKPERAAKKKGQEFTTSDIKHPELFQALKDWRSKKAEQEKIPQFKILHQKILIRVAMYLPKNIIALKLIHGIGSRTAEKYGKELVEIVAAYRQNNNVQQIAPESVYNSETTTKRKAKTTSSETKDLSFDMFNSGLTIAEIAKERGLVQSTIETHLAFFIEDGQLNIDKVISLEKQQIIEKKINEMEGESWGDIKKALGSGYSYGEIKILQAHLKYCK